MSGLIQIVHAIDAEGPLYESLSATFERLREVYGVNLFPSRLNLEKLRNGEFDFGDKSELIREAVSERRVSTLGDWGQIDAMLQKVTSLESRMSNLDSFGNGWVFNWFCTDHVGFEDNPRRRDMGFHNIYDRYCELIESQPYANDTLQWHFHPVSTYREADRRATHYLRSDEVFQILARKILDRSFFPACFRAGFQAERPDSNWFLEQYIPFDISNMSTEDTTDIDNSIDFRNGRSGNWRQAPSDWSVYHPSHDDYQIPGGCRRLIGRALNLRNRIGNVTQEEVNIGFERAARGEKVLMGICSHDWRDLEPELQDFHTMLANSKELFPDVPVQYCQAVEAFQSHVSDLYRSEDPIELSINLVPSDGIDAPFIKVEAVKGRVFGPQPFLAIKTKSKRYLHDNFDFHTEHGTWFYPFYGSTLPIDEIEKIGVAANDFMGRTSVKILEL